MSKTIITVAPTGGAEVASPTEAREILQLKKQRNNESN